MTTRATSGIRYYPDYVLGVHRNRHDERGDFLCEAKFRIPSKKQLHYDLGQAKSYAYRLRSNGLLLASAEGIWLSSAEDNFSPAKLLEYSWKELEFSDIFYDVKNMICKLVKI